MCKSTEGLSDICKFNDVLDNMWEFNEGMDEISKSNDGLENMYKPDGGMDERCKSYEGRMECVNLIRVWLGLKNLRRV